jgi:hypothetical protein
MPGDLPSKYSYDNKTYLLLILSKHPIRRFKKTFYRKLITSIYRFPKFDSNCYLNLLDGTQVANLKVHGILRVYLSK